MKRKLEEGNHPVKYLEQSTYCIDQCFLYLQIVLFWSPILNFSFAFQTTESQEM